MAVVFELALDLLAAVEFHEKWQWDRSDSRILQARECTKEMWRIISTLRRARKRSHPTLEVSAIAFDVSPGAFWLSFSAAVGADGQRRVVAFAKGAAHLSLRATDGLLLNVAVAQWSRSRRDRFTKPRRHKCFRLMRELSMARLMPRKCTDTVRLSRTKDLGGFAPE